MSVKKSDLLAQANELGLDVSEKNTVAEIRDAIKGADNDNRGFPEQEVDQDGNVRTSGKSYGVAPSDPESKEN